MMNKKKKKNENVNQTRKTDYFKAYVHKFV